MVTPIPAAIAARFPAEQIRYVVAEAERDADRVGEYLTAAGLAPPPGQTRGFTPGVLLDLGGIMRLRAWEAAGLTAHRDAGLPSAGEAMTNLIATLFAAAKDPAVLQQTGALARSVFGVMLDRFAWAGPADLDADVVLDVPDEGTLLDALAKLLWANRRRPQAP